MTEMLHAEQVGGVSTADLIERARRLANAARPRSAVACRPEEPAEHDEPQTPLPVIRRMMLTTYLRSSSTLHMEQHLLPAYERVHFVLDDHSEAFTTRIGWAMTDVAWFFADHADPFGDARMGDPRTFLTEIGEVVPVRQQPAGTRALPDLERLVAIAIADNHYYGKDAEEPVEFDSLLELVAARAIAVLLGCVRAWPVELDILGPYVVTGLLEQIEGWANAPWTLNVWDADVEPDEFIVPHLSGPRVITLAAQYLERQYMFLTNESNG
jgi:hypothetical protein